MYLQWCLFILCITIIILQKLDYEGKFKQSLQQIKKSIWQRKKTLHFLSSGWCYPERWCCSNLHESVAKWNEWNITHFLEYVNNTQLFLLIVRGVVLPDLSGFPDFFVITFWNFSVWIKQFYLFSAFLESILASYMYFQDLLLGANYIPVIVH